MANKFLKPAAIKIDGVEMAALVRDPETMQPLNEAGEWKTMSPFWTRRIRDKEVIDATAEAAAPKRKPPSPAVDTVRI